MSLGIFLKLRPFDRALLLSLCWVLSRINLTTSDERCDFSRAGPVPDRSNMLSQCPSDGKNIVIFVG